MVPSQQSALALGLAVLLGTAAIPLLSSADSGRRFYPDDPIRKEPEPIPVNGVSVRKVDDIYDFLENTYVTPGRQGAQARRSPLRARDVNTLGEVPDSPWYTNRHARRRMSIVELKRGPGNSSPPSRRSPWRVVAAKSDGVTPGFVIEDNAKQRYLLKLDPPEAPEVPSGADIIGSKFFYALGYSTPENYVVRFTADDLEIPEGATWRDAGGHRHALTRPVILKMLSGQRPLSNGRYRALASRWMDGKVVGPFNYRGTRSDDPNDIINHEDRRCLRGLAVFCAWLNHHDTRSINTLDLLVGESDHQYLKHALIDFGSILGSAGYGIKEPWMGSQHLIARKDALVQVLTFGFKPPRFMRTHYPDYTGAGRLDSWSFDPLNWKSNYPNPAFLSMDANDAFWAAKQVAAFTDEDIRAIVSTAEFSDPRATDWVGRCVMERRDKVVRSWFAKVLPLDRFRVADGALNFDDLATENGLLPSQPYDVAWSVLDNQRGTLSPLASPHGRRIPSSTGAEYLAATISAADSKAKAVVVYLWRRSETDYHVVGVDR